MSPAGITRVAGFCFWIATAFSVACVIVILCRDTTPIEPWEQATLPLSWMLAGAAALLFLATEVGHTMAHRKNEHVALSVPPEEENAYVKISRQDFVSFVGQGFERLDEYERGDLDAEQVPPVKLARYESSSR
jgi:hypothetical protein